MDEKAISMITGNSFAKLLQRPISGGMLGHTAVNDATRSDFDQQQYIEDAKAGGDGDHEITGYDRLGMIVDECVPGLRRRPWPSGQHRARPVGSYRAGRNLDAELQEQLIGDACLSPDRIFANHFSDQPTGPINNSLVVNNGLIRIGIQLPPNSFSSSPPQFTISAVQDPYGCALTTNAQGQQTVSVYRRPLPATNLGFLSTVMWDGRESFLNPLNNGQNFSANLNADLTQQAIDATLTHAQATEPPTPTQLSQIVSFELALNSAQLYDFNAGNLYEQNGSQGGPQFLPMYSITRVLTTPLVTIPRASHSRPMFSRFTNHGRIRKIYNRPRLRVANKSLIPSRSPSAMCQA
jgi:hypothetical protein